MLTAYLHAFLHNTCNPRCQVCALFRAVAEHLLCDFDAGNLVKMSCSGMAKQPGLQLFIDTELIGRCSEDILQCARGDAFFTFEYEQWSFFATLLVQIAADDFTKTMRHNHVAVPSSFFPDPQQVACEMAMKHVGTSAESCLIMKYPLIKGKLR